MIRANRDEKVLNSTFSILYRCCLATNDLHLLVLTLTTIQNIQTLEWPLLLSWRGLAWRSRLQRLFNGPPPKTSPERSGIESPQSTLEITSLAVPITSATVTGSLAYLDNSKTQPNMRSDPRRPGSFKKRISPAEYEGELYMIYGEAFTVADCYPR